MSDNEMKTHISQFSIKSARNIATNLSYDPNDTYHANIFNSARVLCSSGYTDVVYQTQWMSGTTLWTQEWPHRSIMVTADGEITTR